MTGTVLATILATLLAQFLVGGALLAAFRLKRQQEAKPTRKRREEQFVTHEELSEAIEAATKELNYEWNEWYEKFDKLHLRLAKRAARAEKQQEQQQEEMFEEQGPPVSVLNFRRVGSV